MNTNLTLWIDSNTGERLRRGTLDAYRLRAHRAYEANRHIFEDEVDALNALGVVPMLVANAA